MGMGQYLLNTIFSGMNIHLPAILGFTRYQGFDPSPYEESRRILMKVDLWVGQLVGSAMICLAGIYSSWLQELLAVKVGNIMKHRKHAPVRGSHDMIIRVYV